MIAGDWKIAWYDAVAETYDRIAVPHLFTQPAKDLAGTLDLPRDAKVLDIGAGTGIAALEASRRLGAGALVVALDPSIGMLRRAREKGLRSLVAGVVPGLPFPDAVFDGVLAAFVLSHVRSYRAALPDMVRVLRPGGTLAVTSWGPDQSAVRKLWQATANSYAGKDHLGFRMREALPWEEWFSDAGHLAEALREAGLEGIDVRRREYTMTMTVNDFLAMREITIQARLMRELLDASQWEGFRQSVEDAYRTHYGVWVEDTRDFYVAAGTRVWA